jgi:ankyrin repeat protein
MRPFGIEDEDEDFLNSSSQSPVPSSDGIPDGAPHSICGPSSSSSNLETIRRYFSLDSQDVVTARIEELQRLACTADDKGYTPLHTAAALCMASNVTTYGFQRDNVRLLLSAGANVACPDYSGNSPLHWAARAGDSDIAYLLILKSCPIGKTHQSSFVFIIFFICPSF